MMCCIFVVADDAQSGAIERTSHAPKGGAGNLGVAKMAETTRLLEEAARAGDLSTAPALLRRLAADFEEARAELSAPPL